MNEDTAHLESLIKTATGSKLVALTKQLELLRHQVRLAAIPERSVAVVDVGTLTPEQQMSCIVRWRKSLRRFLAP